MNEKYLDANLTPKERAEDLLSRLNLREKAGQVNQHHYGFAAYKVKNCDVALTEAFLQEIEQFCGLGVLYGLYRADPWSAKDYSNGLTGELAAKAYNLIQQRVMEASRFHIPMLMSSECPHGHQALDGYLLPVNLAMGATFNPSLVEEAYIMCGAQMKRQNVDMALISMLDVLRDPRWGRSEECFSEDPLLCARLAQAVVKGCQSQNVPVVAKHFCAQGETTGGINASAARIGERELREIHLSPMKAAIKAGVKGVMAAYNEIDGVPCHGNSWLLKNVLRDEMGFDGIVMADGTAIDRLTVLTGDTVSAGALALNAGVDVSLWDEGFTQLEEAVEKGLVSESSLNAAVMRVLEMKFERGLFEKPYIKTPTKAFSVPVYDPALELSRQSLVLLKNEGCLPLCEQHVKSIAVVGPYCDDVYSQAGDYTPSIKKEDGISFLAGLKQFSPEAVEIKKLGGVSPWSMEYLDKAEKLSQACDITVLVLGGSSSRFTGADFDINGAALSISAGTDCGEGVDVSELSLSGNQAELAKRLIAAGKPVITVVNAGRPYAVGELMGTSAFIYAFYGGPKAGQALAEMLWGKISPSGRLPVSLPRSSGQIPVYYNPKASYDFLKYSDLEASPLFSFGYGLGYSDISLSSAELNYSSLSISQLESEIFIVSFDIENKGGRDEWAVPMLFIKRKSASVVPRVQELKDFEKVLVRANRKAKVTLALGKEELSLWNREMLFEPEAGEITLSLFEGTKEWYSFNIKITAD